MFTKKSCINCAFCLHCRDTFYGFPKSDWEYKRDNLTDNEVSLLMNGDISFLSESQRKHDEWVATYEKRKEERRKNIEEANKEFENTVLGKAFGKDFLNKISSLSEISSPVFGSNPYPLREEFGMEPCPIVPNYEYLKCWKEVWGEKNKYIWSELKNKKCDNYYPLSKKETKTLKACDEERKEKADNRKFWRGAVIGFISASIVMLMRFLIAPYFTYSNNEAVNYSTQQEQQSVIEEQPIKSQTNDVSVSAQEDAEQDINKNTAETNEVKLKVSESEE